MSNQNTNTHPYSAWTFHDQFNYVSNICLSVVSAIWAIIICIFGIKVYIVVKNKSKTIKCNDKLMFVVILIFDLMLVAYSIFFALNAYTVKTWYYWYHLDILTICSISPAYLQLTACILNARNWIYFYIGIKAAR